MHVVLTVAEVHVLVLAPHGVQALFAKKKPSLHAEQAVFVHVLQPFPHAVQTLPSRYEPSIHAVHVAASVHVLQLAEHATHALATRT
jgi:hypothetical protein